MIDWKMHSQLVLAVIYYNTLVNHPQLTIQRANQSHTIARATIIPCHKAAFTTTLIASPSASADITPMKVSSQTTLPAQPDTNASPYPHIPRLKIQNYILYRTLLAIPPTLAPSNKVSPSPWHPANCTTSSGPRRSHQIRSVDPASTALTSPCSPLLPSYSPLALFFGSLGKRQRRRRISLVIWRTCATCSW